MKEIFSQQQITAELAGAYAEYAMMASNSYHKSDRVRFALEKLGWVQVSHDGQPTSAPTMQYHSGLAYDIYEKQNSDDVVWAIRGTENLLDFAFANFATPPFALQYEEVRKDFGEYVEAHPKKKVVAVTGHSLGGGLALSISVHYGVDAITFDASPRIFDGLGDHHASAKRVLIYENGEILQHVRSHLKKIFEVVPQENIHTCNFDFDDIGRRLGKKVSDDGRHEIIMKLGLLKHTEDYVKLAIKDHCSDCLAFGLLDLGVSANQRLAPIRAALPINQ